MAGWLAPGGCLRGSPFRPRPPPPCDPASAHKCQLPSLRRAWGQASGPAPGPSPSLLRDLDASLTSPHLLVGITGVLLPTTFTGRSEIK